MTVTCSLFFSLSYSVRTATCNGHLCMQLFSFSPRSRFVRGLLYKPKCRANIFYSLFFILFLLRSLILAVRISLLFFIQYLKNFTGPGLHKIRQPSLVCCRGLCLITVYFKTLPVVDPTFIKTPAFYSRAGVYSFFHVSVEKSNSRLLWFCITITTLIGLKKLAPLSQPIRSKTKVCLSQSRTIYRALYVRYIYLL